MAWRAFWISRLLVWSAGIIGVLASDAGAWRQLNPGISDPSDSVSGLLLSPANRWDASFYLSIAQHGYSGSPESTTAFFPLYPLSLRVVGEPIDALGFAGAHAFEVAGILVSLAAFIVALYLLHRLTELELGRRAADNAVMFLALFPTSFYFSAIYTESLFLALSVGCLYSARCGYWWRAALLAAFASATRSQGLLLLLPMAIMLWYGPRPDRKRPSSAQRGRLRPRYRPSLREAGSLLLVPLGLIAFMTYIRATTSYGASTPIKGQGQWGHEFQVPVVGLWTGVKGGVEAVRDLVAGARLNGPYSAVREHLVELAALGFAGIGVAGAFRRLPIAYAAYALAGLAFALSFPTTLYGVENPLRSLPRYVIVLFPIFMWAGRAIACSDRSKLVLGVSAAGLACFSAAFASGYWIA